MLHDVILSTSYHHFITDARHGKGLNLYRPVGRCVEIIEAEFIMWITTPVLLLGRGQILNDCNALPTGKENELR